MILRLIRPLSSRKVRVALATVIATYAVEFGIQLESDLVFTILGVGVALILGIAHEDAGRNANAAQTGRVENAATKS